MSSFRVDVQGDFPNQFIETTLDGVPYTLQFQFNERESYWYLHIWDEQQTTLLGSNQKLVLDYPMYLDILPGFLYATLAEGLLRRPSDLTQMNLSYYDFESRQALLDGSLTEITT